MLEDLGLHRRHVANGTAPLPPGRCRYCDLWIHRLLARERDLGWKYRRRSPAPLPADRADTEPPRRDRLADEALDAEASEHAWQEYTGLAMDRAEPETCAETAGAQ